MVGSLEKTSLCLAVMFFKYICLQVNNEYSDTAVGWSCKYRGKIGCNNFVSVDGLLSIYNKNVH